MGEAFVVDTNVAATANGAADHAGPNCVRACIEALEHVVRQCRLVIDDRQRILGEYLRNLSLSGQPGPGDFFVKWAWDNQANRERCEQVPLTPTGGDPEDFEEFPRDRSLEGFDRSDRKFVAVALASKLGPRVMNATDTDWWIYRQALRRRGIVVEFLCVSLMRRKRDTP